MTAISLSNGIDDYAIFAGGVTTNGMRSNKIDFITFT